MQIQTEKKSLLVTDENAKMQVITVTNEKGGTGKTTVSVHLAFLLAAAGNQVLLLDADAQATLTESCGVTPAPALHDWVVRDYPLEKLVARQEYGRGNVDVLPGNIETRKITSMDIDPLAVYDRLVAVGNKYDYTIIDTSPSPSLFHSMLYMASDYIVLPTQLEDFSINSMKKTLAHIDQANRFRVGLGEKAIGVAGIIPTLFRKRRNLADTYLEHLKDTYDRVLTPIPDREDFRFAAAGSMLVTDYAPDGEAAAAMENMVSEIMVGVK